MRRLMSDPSASAARSSASVAESGLVLIGAELAGSFTEAFKLLVWIDPSLLRAGLK
jgi:hypothetical protein